MEGGEASPGKMADAVEHGRGSRGLVGRHGNEGAIEDDRPKPYPGRREWGCSHEPGWSRLGNGILF